ncbi:hypothetical protein IZ6_04770 [Terrihabitans soli]|uniref:DUF2502 domain-containing protein n=1 Tax=Terrihabitans soli TaxID=708113 RepID=A0A6S6QR46_9HYPH|nr:hypothetical protein [Terrihabitans soli]BCJ89742.1 hypothetical protein IZ6_04770 [Terrihabitans soli]
MKLNFGWLMGCAVATVVVVAGAGDALAWHKGYPHDGGHNKWKSQEYNSHNKWKSQQYNSHNKWKSQEYNDYHGPNKSQYQKKKYYHQKYGSWGSHPQCMHLGPFGICEY